MLIKNIYNHIKYTRILNKVYKKDNIIQNMNQLLNTEFKRDWVGRLYTILNPNLIPENDKIFELTNTGRDNKAFIEKWIMDRFIIMDRFVKANNLFDILSYNLDKIDEYDNYLLIIKPITYDDFVSSLKKISFLFILILISVIIVSILI